MLTMAAAAAVIVAVSHWDIHALMQRFDAVDSALTERGEWMRRVNEKLNVEPSRDAFAPSVGFIEVK